MHRLVFVDTETTGFAAGDICWQIGLVTCDFQDNSYDTIISRTEEEVVLPRLPSEWPRRSFQLGTIIESCRRDCDDAAENTKDLMAGRYDRDEFKEEMILYLDSVRGERISEVKSHLELADEVVAWNAKFDKKVLCDVCEFSDLTTICAMEKFRRNYPGIRWKLSYAADYFGIPVDGVRHHTALYDTLLLEKVWFKMHGVKPKLKKFISKKGKRKKDERAVMTLRIRRAFGRP